MVRLFVFLGILICVSWPPGKDAFVSMQTKKIFIGVDGVSREEFDHAREKLGLFSSLKHTSTHVAPFPSISDYSWNTLVGARKVHGPRGRIRHYEAAHFDRDRKELVSDPREYFRRLGEDQHYFTGAFEHWLNPYVESLLYIPTEELPRLELKQLLEAVKNDKDNLVTVMVASSDALAHTRSDGSKFLVHLDKFISEIEAHYAKEKQNVEIILVSDHGQASRFLPGQTPLPLLPVNINDVLKRAELQNEVIMPVMALANYGTVYFKDKSKRSALVSELRKEKWFSFAASMEVQNPQERIVSVFDGEGEAKLKVRKTDGFEYFYTVSNGDPLGVASSVQNRWITDTEARALKLKYPDAFYRLAFSAFEEEAEFPDFIFTLKDEYFLAGELNSFTTMYQTHGSLGLRSSSGIVASTHPLKSDRDELRTEEVLSAVGITPKQMFASTKRKEIAAPSGFLATGSEEWDNRRIFALMNRAVQDSRYVLDGKSFNVVLDVVRPLLERKSPEVPQVKWNEVMGLKDVAHLVDLMIRNGSIDTVKKDPRFQEIKARLAQTNVKSTRAPSAEDQHWSSLAFIHKADAAKKIVMKTYGSMFLLEKALTLPEMPFIKDERTPFLIKDNNPARTFASIFEERKLLKETWPLEFPLQWAPVLPSEETTLVYIPGIYNSLFDDEIFRSGLDRLRDKWGVRIISPNVFSTCSSTVNGKLILDQLKEDQKTQISIGKRPVYFVLGYSKGGVDALHAFAEDPEFVSTNVAGLLTIASPVKGSSILNKTDLPFEVMHALGYENAPAICQTEEKAAKSVTPSGAQTFLKKNAPKLVGLTRYYSMSFASELRDSHLFMRATKNIARFGEPNDGVVALSASRFPDEFKAIDLGVVKADHLSGIVAGHFPQDAFMESVLFTLGRENAFEKNTVVNETITYQFKKTDPDRHRSTLSKKIGPLLTDAFKKNAPLNELTEKIKATLSKTDYALKHFFLVKRNNELHVRFHDGRWSTFIRGATVAMKSPEELRDFLLANLQSSGRNLLKSGRREIPESNRVPANAPVNELGFNEDLRLNLRDLDKFITGKRVVPVTYLTHPEGFSFVYDHASSVDFRNEFQLSFEDSAPPESDDHSASGWETYLDPEKKVWGKLASANSSVRLTTYSWRFLAADYPDLNLEIQVNDDVEGADVLYGGTGKDDSAFQLWFTFRTIEDGKNREYLSTDENMRTIGYYFGDEISGKNLEVNKIYQNYYSEKDFIVAKLPAAKQKLIGLGKNMMGVPLLTTHNLLEDIRASYPDIDPSKAEIVAITIQHDSNDTKGKSEALFRSLSLRPNPRKTFTYLQK